MALKLLDRRRRLRGRWLTIGVVWLLLALAAPNLGWAADAATSSRYLTMRDGVRLAADIRLPVGAARGSRVPAIVQFTRYWRSRAGDDSGSSNPAAEHFSEAGYAFIVVDVRGTGASFGHRDTEFSPAEVEDMGQVIDWIAQQPWSNGRVATMGSSYLGNTAELAAIPARPALRAIVSRFSDFSEYRHAIRPGGIRNSVISDAWVSLTSALDANDVCRLRQEGSCPEAAGGVRPVDGDEGGALLRAAVAEHRRNADLHSIVDDLVFSDDPFGSDGRKVFTLDGVSPSANWPQIDAAGVPSFHWGSWFDGGTAEGVLTRFLNYRSPIRGIIGAWNHGGTRQVDPFSDREERPAAPPPAEQFRMIEDFLDPLMKGDRRAASEGPSTITYYTVGRDQWRETAIWPPAGIAPRRYFLGHARSLTTTGPAEPGGDIYNADLDSSTGARNRWHTQLGASVAYGDRGPQSDRLLTYTSPPLPRDTEITGSPVIRFFLETETGDGALFVYLEDVSPEGRVSYLTEGQLRLAFHGEPQSTSHARHLGPTHDFTRASAREVLNGRPMLLNFSMFPISVELKKGHRLRISIAASDSETFGRVRAGPAPVYRILFGPGHPSWIELPMGESR